MLKIFPKSLKDIRDTEKNMKSYKKILTIGAILVGLFIQVTASEICPYAVRVAINKYKNHDYVGCIQDLEDYTQSDPSNAIAFYYSGIAYMKVGMKDKAVEAFEKVASINSVPILSSYAIQATNCINSNISPCTYKKYSKDEIQEMLVDPGAFFAKKEKEPEDKAIEAVSVDSDIDKLIHGAYPDNIHPDANKVIQETRLIQEQERVNAELNRKTRPNASNKKSDTSSEMKDLVKVSKANPSDKEIADAVRTLSKAGYTFSAPSKEVGGSVGTVASNEKSMFSNDKNTENSANNNKNNNFNPYKQMAEYYAMNGDAAQMAMMFGGGNGYNRGNSFDMMVPFLLMQQQQKNADGTPSQNKIDPEVIKTMMMGQMMNSFDFGFDNDDRRR